MNLTFSIVGLVQGGEGHVKAYSIDFLLCLYIISGPALWQYCKQHRLMKSYTFICVTFSTVFQCGSWDTNVKLLHNFLLLAMAQTRSKIGFMTFPHKTKGKHFFWLPKNQENTKKIPQNPDKKKNPRALIVRKIATKTYFEHLSPPPIITLLWVHGLEGGLGRDWIEPGSLLPYKWSNLLLLHGPFQFFGWQEWNHCEIEHFITNVLSSRQPVWSILVSWVNFGCNCLLSSEEVFSG